MMGIDWTQWASLLTVIGVLSGVVSVITRRWLRAEFATHAALVVVEKRVAILEQTALPSREELQRLTNSINDLTTVMAGLKAADEGLRDMVRRVERNIDLLMQHALKEVAS
jgi:cob(I)alamin adenosyltransferase